MWGNSDKQFYHLTTMKNLLRNIWEAPASTSAAAIMAGLGVYTVSDLSMPQWLLVTLMAISSALALFAGPIQPKQ